jgi:hypothetical protein
MFVMVLVTPPLDFTHILLQFVIYLLGRVEVSGLEGAARMGYKTFAETVVPVRPGAIVTLQLSLI